MDNLQSIADDHTPQNTLTLGSSANVSEVPLMNILSWNIHDAMDSGEGLKTDDAEFSDILTKNSIFCLQETKREICLPNYKCFNQTRCDSRSGGLCIGVQRTLAEKVKVLKTKYDDIQAITVTPNASSNEGKFTLINIYDSPDKTKRRLIGGETVTTLDMLLEFVMSMNNNDMGEIFLAGDLNARTRNLNNCTTDNEEFSARSAARVSSHPAESLRASKDNTLNARGKHLLDFLACTNLSLLNGNTLGDIFGEFTSVNYNGSAVVDYMAASPGVFKQVQCFQVLNLTRFSDHKPCICTLKLGHSYVSPDHLLDSLQDVPPKYKWNSDSSIVNKLFLEAQDDSAIKEEAQAILESECVSEGDVFNLNERVVALLRSIADTIIEKNQPSAPISRSKAAKKNKKRKGRRMKAKSPWFDASCINAKRELNRLAKRYGKSPTDKELRDLYYAKRKEYRRIIKRKKGAFFDELSRDIEDGKNINWSKFKKLKGTTAKTANLDVFDMINFCNFFEDLYGSPTLTQERIDELSADMTNGDIRSNLTESLNRDISLDELSECINSLKKGKAVAEDLIANEFLKFSSTNVRESVCHLFNECLRLGVYPWHTSVVTPLHKKGSIYDPNNYRAIAVASNMGKLFASILLQRLITFRTSCYPDTTNRLGFCKNAQTSDHIMTLTTRINKYVQHSKGRLYACFVDYAKAFDTVCREALLFKMWKLGIKGKFFDCLKNMYSNSKAKVKLLNKLSAEIDILCGTEQGHPMSPELFKCYVHDLSEDLNNASESGDIDVPILSNMMISHLLWADDLILLALNPQSLQKMLLILEAYCTEWGLRVNISKTAVMVFNKSGKLLKESSGFFYGEINIPAAREYCYLGITFALTGSLTPAQQKLRHKGLRSYFSLKSMIDISNLRKTTVFKLFDTLICPVVSYGCQVWLPETWFIRQLLEHGTQNRLATIARDPLEKLHLAFLKWTMGVGKRTSNAAVWGDCGRYPLVIHLSKQVFSYYDRLQKLDTENSSSLVTYAFREQKTLNLTWYSRLSEARTILQNQRTGNHLFPSQLRSELRAGFENIWEQERHMNSKLGFYNTIKDNFKPEYYLSMSLSYDEGKRISQLRSSSHKFNIETGRYGVKRENLVNRLCRTCSTTDNDILQGLVDLPTFEPILEDELHILRTCPLYQDLRYNLTDPVKTNIFADIRSLFTSAPQVRELARFLVKVHKRRFPKKKDTVQTSSPATGL